MVKPTDDNLSRYFFKAPDSLFFRIFDFFILPFKIFYEILKSIIVSLIRFPEHIWFKYAPMNQVKRLFISHFTPAQIKSETDFFFGFNTFQESSATFFLNHTRIYSFQINTLLKNRKDRKSIINTKSLSINRILMLQLKQFKTTLQLLWYAIFSPNLSNYERRLLIRGCYFQHARASISNQVLTERLKTIFRNCKPIEIVITLEGHAYELGIINLCKKISPRTRILAYQHAPLVPHQFDFFRNASQLDSEDVILTIGKASASFIESRLPHLDVKVIGSPKFLMPKVVEKRNSNLTVLGAPEGTMKTSLKFVKLFNELSLQMPEIDFVLRIHPDANRKTLRAIKKLIVLSKNLRISTKSLSDDLTESNVVVFRSSLVGIESLSRSALPLHYDSEENGGLNPLTIESVFTYFTFSNAAELMVQLYGSKPLLLQSISAENMVATYHKIMSPLSLIDEVII